jgi:hypothetical protein
MDKNKTNELNKALEGMWDSLTDEQKIKAKECKSMDELMLLAGKFGVELPDEMLTCVAGGATRDLPPFTCPYCGATHKNKTGTKKIKPANEAKEVYVQIYFCPKYHREFYRNPDGTRYDDSLQEVHSIISSKCK